MKDKKKNLGKSVEEPPASAADKAPRNRKTKDLFDFDEAFDVWGSVNPTAQEENKENEENKEELKDVNEEEKAKKSSSPKNKLSVILNSATKFKALEKFVKSARKNLSK